MISKTYDILPALCKNWRNVVVHDRIYLRKKALRNLHEYLIRQLGFSNLPLHLARQKVLMSNGDYFLLMVLSN
jgi:hypothetical protein